MRVKIISIKDRDGKDREDKFYPAIINQCGEVLRMEAREGMIIQMDIARGESVPLTIRTSKVSEVSQRGKDITVRTANSVYRLEVVEE